MLYNLTIRIYCTVILSLTYHIINFVALQTTSNKTNNIEEDQDDDTDDDDESIQKAREWDDWKDTHKRGWGNRMNRG